MKLALSRRQATPSSAAVLLSLVDDGRRSAAAQEFAEAMVVLSQSKFLSELTVLFESTKEKGSLSITHKRSASAPRRPARAPPGTAAGRWRLSSPFVADRARPPRSERRRQKSRGRRRGRRGR